MVFKIKVELYKTSVHFLIGENDEFAEKYVERITDGDFTNGIPIDDTTYEARCLLRDDGLCVVRLAKEAPISTVTHELAHVAFHILRWVGMYHHDASEEAYCYLLEYLLKKYDKKLKKILRSENK